MFTVYILQASTAQVIDNLALLGKQSAVKRTRTQANGRRRLTVQSGKIEESIRYINGLQKLFLGLPGPEASPLASTQALRFAGALLPVFR
jgi:hypothetical protein